MARLREQLCKLVNPTTAWLRVGIILSTLAGIVFLSLPVAGERVWGPFAQWWQPEYAGKVVPGDVLVFCWAKTWVLLMFLGALSCGIHVAPRLIQEVLRLWKAS